MPTTSADFHLLDGDTPPAAPDAGFVRFFFLNGLPSMRRHGQVPIDLRPRWPITFSFAGECVDEALFGRHTVGEAVFVTRLELEAQEAPGGSPLQVELVDASGAAFSPPRTITIAGGEFYANADITDLALAVNAGIRARIKSVGADQPGGDLTLRIFLTPQ